eukprot:7388675-Prymnesium_polylepis.2
MRYAHRNPRSSPRPTTVVDAICFRSAGEDQGHAGKDQEEVSVSPKRSGVRCAVRKGRHVATLTGGRVQFQCRSAP